MRVISNIDSLSSPFWFCPLPVITCPVTANYSPVSEYIVRWLELGKHEMEVTVILIRVFNGVFYLRVSLLSHFRWKLIAAGRGCANAPLQLRQLPRDVTLTPPLWSRILNNGKCHKGITIIYIWTFKCLISRYEVIKPCCQQHEQEKMRLFVSSRYMPHILGFLQEYLHCINSLQIRLILFTLDFTLSNTFFAKWMACITGSLKLSHVPPHLIFQGRVNKSEKTEGRIALH